jgi:hypothetical protein
MAMNKQEIIRSLFGFCDELILDGDKIYLEHTTPLVWLEIDDGSITVGRENPRLSAEWLAGNDDSIRQVFENITDIEDIVCVWGVFQETLDEYADLD